MYHGHDLQFGPFENSQNSHGTKAAFDVGVRKERRRRRNRRREERPKGRKEGRKEGSRVCELGYCAIAHRYRRIVILRLFRAQVFKDHLLGTDSDACDFGVFSSRVSSRYSFWGNEVMERLPLVVLPHKQIQVPIYSIIRCAVLL